MEKETSELIQKLFIHPWDQARGPLRKQMGGSMQGYLLADQVKGENLSRYRVIWEAFMCVRVRLPITI